MKDHLPQNGIVFTMSIKSLYPIIPKEHGLEACRQTLKERKIKHIPTVTVMEQLEITFENNIFQISGINYQQMNGTAIGSSSRKELCLYIFREM